MSGSWRVKKWFYNIPEFYWQLLVPVVSINWPSSPVPSQPDVIIMAVGQGTLGVVLKGHRLCLMTVCQFIWIVFHGSCHKATASGYSSSLFKVFPWFVSLAFLLYISAGNPLKYWKNTVRWIIWQGIESGYIGSWEEVAKLKPVS